MNSELMKQYVDLTRRKREVEGQLRGIQKSIDAVEPMLLEDMASDAVQSINIDGATVYRQRDTTVSFADGFDRSDVVDALLGAGMFECVGVVHQTLKSRVKEIIEAGETLPAEVASRVQIGERYSLRMRG